MKETDVIEVLQSCHSIYINLHDKVGHNLTDQELALLGKFKIIWEEVSFSNSEWMKVAGMGAYELAFLGGYIYDFDDYNRLPQIEFLRLED